MQKYGGSSVATADKIKRIARRIAWRRRQGDQVVVVVSAQGDTTDHLLKSAAEISAAPTPREMDVLLAAGEQMSMALLAMALNDLDCPAISLTGPQAGIYTDENHTSAKIKTLDPARVLTELDAGYVVVVAGFQGADPAGDIATLGRGGSDATAIALAAALEADHCQVFTDVDGVYTADPRIVPTARRMDQVSYDELLELAAAGAQVMQLRSVELAKQFGVAFEVLSSLAPLPEEGGEEKGTMVVAKLDAEKQRLVSGVAVDYNTARITVMHVPDKPGMAARLFTSLGSQRISADCIVQSGGPGQTVADISFTVKKDELEKAIQVVRQFMDGIAGTRMVYDLDVAKVSIVGAGLASNYGVAAAMFAAMAAEEINIELITGSEIKITCLVRSSRAADAVRAVHDRFRLGDNGVDLDSVLGEASGG